MSEIDKSADDGERRHTTPRPWTVVDYTTATKGYIQIEGPNGEKIADIFPFAGKGGVGLEVARQNAILITILANAREATP